MATIQNKPKIDLKITIEINESEARALKALVGYGFTDFINFFYKTLGKHYLSPHENGLLTFFESVQATIPAALRRLDAARRTFDS